MKLSVSLANVTILSVVIVVLACTFMTADSAATIYQPNKNSTEPKICQPNAPCGWAVYARFTRTVEYFMRNTCECEAGLDCVRVDDDVSVSAYVYRCRQIPPFVAPNPES